MAITAKPPGADHVGATLDQHHQQTINGAEGSKKWTSDYKYESKLPIEKLWAVGGDFTSIHKWIKGIANCDITGDPTQPGCLRHCQVDLEGFGENPFVVEKLLVLNNEEHLMQYSLLENFLGFKDYVGTFKIEPASTSRTDSEDSDGVLQKGGCIVSWSMEVAPVEGKTEEEVVQFSRMMFIQALNGLEAFASTL
ncbi:unnamed protein product [Calypogeia fissa]